MTASAATYPGAASRSTQGHVPRGPRIRPGLHPGRPGVRGHDHLAERGAHPVAGRLGHGFLPGPGDQEGAGPAVGRDRGQRGLFGRGQYHAPQRLGIAVPAEQVRASLGLLDVHADRRPRHRHRDQVARVRDRMPGSAARDGRLAVRLAARRAGPVEAHVRRGPAGVPRERRLGQRAADQEPLAVLRAPVGRPAPPLGLVEHRGEPVRGVRPARPPDVGGPVRQRVLARLFSHAVSLTAGPALSPPPARHSTQAGHQAPTFSAAGGRHGVSIDLQVGYRARTGSGGFTGRIR